MAAEWIVFVHHDGTFARLPFDGRAELPEWRLVAAHDHPGQNAFQRASPSFAIRLMSNDNQGGAIVYVQRPIALYREERAELTRRLDTVTRELEAMPEPERPF